MCYTAAAFFFVVDFIFYYYVDFIYYFFISMSEKYVCCANPRCRPFPGKIRSWKPLTALPATCKFCGDDFPYQGLGGKRGGAKTPKVKFADVGDQFSDEKLRDAFLTRFGDDPDKVSAVKEWLPERPKSHAERRREAYQASDVAFRRHAHQARCLLDMRAAYKKLCDDLIAYKAKLEEQTDRTNTALRVYEEARAELHAVDAAAAPRSSPFPRTTPIPPEVSSASNQVRALLAAHIPAAVLDGLGNQISTILRDVVVPATALTPNMSDGEGRWDGQDWDDYNYDYQSTSDLIQQEEHHSLQLEKQMQWADKRGVEEVASGDSDLDSVGDTDHKTRRPRNDADVSSAGIAEAEELAALSASIPEVSVAASNPASQSTSSVLKGDGSGDKGGDNDGFTQVGGKKGKKARGKQRAGPYGASASPAPKSRG